MTPGSAGITLAGLIILAIAVCLLVFGCVHVATEPALPLPDRPTLRFFRCGPEDAWVCLTEPEANALLRYIEKLNAWDAARAQLLK